MRGRPERIGPEVAERLRARGAEVEEAILTRVYAVLDPTTIENSDYEHGLRDAAAAALAYGLEAIALGEERAGPMPLPILSQARNAARNGVGLEVVLRRYTAGYAVLCDFLMQEMRRAPSLTEPSYGSQRNLTAVFDRLVSVVSAEYCAEADERPPPLAKERKAERVKRLLRGELVDASGLDYDFGGWHLGIVVAGNGASEALLDLAKRVERRLILVELHDRGAWAWLGGDRELEHGRLVAGLEGNWPGEILLGFGEPAEGVQGWRRTHRQAAAALSVGLRTMTRVASYENTALLSVALKDDDLCAFLSEKYLRPLSKGRDGGEPIRETVSAYLRCQRNVSSTAALLGVNRHTVTNRVRSAERRLGRTIDSCLAELDLALRLVDLQSNRATFAT